MQKANRRIKLVWIGEGFIYVALAMMFLVALGGYLSFFLRLELIPFGIGGFTALMAAAVALLFLALLFFVWASFRYRSYGYVLEADHLTILDGSLFSQKHAVPYNRIENAYAANSGVPGLLQKLMGLYTVCVVTNDKSPITFHINGVAEPSPLIKNLMDNVGFAEDARKPEGDDPRMDIIKEIDAVKKAERREEEADGRYVPKEPAREGFKDRIIEGHSHSRGSLRSIVESKLKDACERGENSCAYCNMEMRDPMNSEYGDEMLQSLAMVQENSKKRAKARKKSTPSGKRAVRGMFSPEKLKNSTGDIIQS